MTQLPGPSARPPVGDKEGRSSRYRVARPQAVEVDASANEKFKAFVSQIANSPKKSGLGTTDQVTNFEVRVRFVTPTHHACALA